MKIKINCPNPVSLKDKIINDSEEGVLKTWTVCTGSKSGKMLTYSAEQYENKALIVLAPDEKNHVLTGHLTFWENREEPDYAIKAIYIGRFSQAILTHYEQYFDEIKISK